MSWPILSVTTFLPLLGAALIVIMVRGGDEAGTRNARWIALWTTLVTFAVSLVMVWTATVAFVAFYVVKLVVGLRVPEEEEREGLDITSHGERAYDL